MLIQHLLLIHTLICYFLRICIRIMGSKYNFLSCSSWIVFHIRLFKTYTNLHSHQQCTELVLNWNISHALLDRISVILARLRKSFICQINSLFYFAFRIYCLFILNTINEQIFYSDFIMHKSGNSRVKCSYYN